MRKVLLIAVAVVACSKAETPATDTAAAAPAPPPAPALLTAADVRGVWNGTSKREGTDSTVAFTVISTSDSTGKIVFANLKDSVSTTSKFDGDSVIVTSASYKDPAAPKNAPPVIFRSVGRLKDGKLVGTASIMPAAKPDSVVGRATWEATKAP
jgi:hypothetical protein